MCGRKLATFCHLFMWAITYIVSWISKGNLKKILACAWHYHVPNVDTKFLWDRYSISYNRKGVTALTVFLLSKEYYRAGKCNAPVDCYFYLSSIGNLPV